MRSRQALQKPRVSKFLPRKGTETVTLKGNHDIRSFKIFTPQGDGNQHLESLTLQSPVSKFLPRKGTETEEHPVTVTPSNLFQNFYPARGRKPPIWVASHWHSSNVSKFLPRKGTETQSLSSLSHLKLVSKFLPRKGTETVSPGFSGTFHWRVSKFLPRKGTETSGTDKYAKSERKKFQNIYPARGRKQKNPPILRWKDVRFKIFTPQGDGNVAVVATELPFKVSKFLPRKGTETFRSHRSKFDRFLFQNFYPARGRKRSRQYRKKSY